MNVLRRIGGGIALGLVLCASVGCVQRRLTIRSNPPGAMVSVDNQEIGTTPISTNFTFYGKRHIRIVKDGYETIDDLREIQPPWYQYPGVDLVAETVVPGEIQDRRTLQYTLQPKQQVTENQLLMEAENFMATTRSPSVSTVAPTNSVSNPAGVGGSPTMVAPTTGGGSSGIAPTGTTAGLTAPIIGMR